ncbi:MAG: O-antigen ligase family protein [Planctomycetota bacterium]|nr:O-antigen ligase family protein [Planctomycetota bacterium]
MNAGPPDPPPRTTLSRVGAGLIAFAALSRLFTAASRVPWWDIDPLTSLTPETTRTPATGLLLDALVWLGALLIVLAAPRGRAFPWRTGLLALAGAAGCALHGLLFHPITVGDPPPPRSFPADFDSLTLGSAWSAAVVGGWAIALAARDAALRRMIAGVLLGAAALLAAKGALQVFVEHPRLVDMFRQSREAMLRAQGFEPGSVSALIFERRLVQPEATGWFGLANVFGSVVGASAAALFPSALVASRIRRTTSAGRGPFIALALGAILAAGALVMSGSKGAIAAALAGAFIAILAARQRPARLLRWAPLALAAAALAAVLFRGVIGPALSELSLYFRWQYLIAAVRIILRFLPWGVGPAGFKDAYLLAKEPTSPEEIESPHCLPADWLATLGLAGAAWLALWIIWLCRAGAPAAAAADDTDPPAPHAGRADRLWPLIVIASSTLVSAWTERAAYAPENLIAAALGALTWYLLARAFISLPAAHPRAVSPALFAAACVLAAHCMIEVTPVFPGSAAWVMAIVALAAAPPPHTPATPRRAGSTPRRAALTIAAAAALFITYLGLTLRRAESSLQSAAIAASAMAQAPTAADTRAAADSARDHLRLARARLWSPVSARELEARVLLAAALRLHPVEPAAAHQLAADALALLLENVRAEERSATRWARLAAAAQAALAAGVPAAELPAGADPLDAWAQVAQLDPHGLAAPLAAARLADRRGDAAAAAGFAGRALRIDAALSLDPLKQLRPADRTQMERLAAPANAPSAPPPGASPPPAP